MLSARNRANRIASNQPLGKHLAELRLLGTALNAIYQAATCHRKSWATGHVLEMMGARIYNLAYAAYSLISIGFYDEAMNLTRSIGEIANLVSLSGHNKDQFYAWLKASKEERIRNFSPSRIRRMLGPDGLVLMDADWYSELCESYTHITPWASPNNHNDMNRVICRGMVQEAGIEKSLGQLTIAVGTVALMYCLYFEYDDLFNELIECGDKMKDDPTPAPAARDVK
jgi:hypothetical protein